VIHAAACYLPVAGAGDGVVYNTCVPFVRFPMASGCRLRYATVRQTSWRGCAGAGT